MIRKFKPTDIDLVLKLWLNGNLDAHDFVDRNYWISNAPAVREQLLQAEIYVCEMEGTVRGFAGMQEDYLAGIFVEKDVRSTGIGKQLLEHVKQIHNHITLNVYQKNMRAVAFYLREGFQIAAEGTDPDTGEAEYTMSSRLRKKHTVLTQDA